MPWSRARRAVRRSSLRTIHGVGHRRSAGALPTENHTSVACPRPARQWLRSVVLAGAGGADRIRPFGLDPDVVAGMRRGDLEAATDVHRDVLAAPRTPEQQVTGLELVERHV